MSPRVPVRRAFTLFEVVVTIALLMALVGAMSIFSFNVLRARELTLAASRRQVAAATLIERLERDLRVCLAGNTAHGAGVRGTESSLSLLVRGVPASWAERGLDDPVPFADLERAEYRFDEGRRRLEGRRSVVLDSAEAAGPFIVIGDDLPHVRFRYHDGEDWRTNFDSRAAGRLPRAVEIAVWFAAWPGDEPVDGELDGDEYDIDGEVFAESFDEGLNDEGSFDERGAFDTFGRDEPPMPDRVRIVLIPDAAPATAEPADAFADDAP
ncbi:MAG: PulJ/GspJ family protein [Planctomycetota bacterium]|jgi:hypothetical protein